MPAEFTYNVEIVGYRPSAGEAQSSWAETVVVPRGSGIESVPFPFPAGAGRVPLDYVDVDGNAALWGGELHGVEVRDSIKRLVWLNDSFDTSGRQGDAAPLIIKAADMAGSPIVKVERNHVTPSFAADVVMRMYGRKV